MTSEQIMALLKGLLTKNNMDPGLLDKIGLDEGVLDEAETRIRPAVNNPEQTEVTLRLPTPVALQLCHLLETGVIYGSLVCNAGDVSRDPRSPVTTTKTNDNDPSTDGAA